MIPRLARLVAAALLGVVGLMLPGEAIVATSAQEAQASARSSQSVPSIAALSDYDSRLPSARVQPRHRAAVPSVHGSYLRGVAANAGARGWKVGDPIDNLTKAGGEPAWSTVRARYWKNAGNDAFEGEQTAANLARMQAGKPPLHSTVGVPMELNHITPRWRGGTHAPDNLEPLWPWEHAAVDEHRFYTGPMP